MEDARTTPPSFDEMVGIIEKLFKGSSEITKLFTDAEIESGWQRYKRLNHLYQDENKPGLPPLPEPILTDEDVKDWEGEKEQPGPAWVKGRYDKLYDQVKGGKRVVCYVDYIARGADKVYRDICTVHPGGMEFVARGIGYGSVKYIEGDERTNFIGLCEMKNVEWLDESATTANEWDSIRLVGRVKERFKELEEKQHDWRSFYCAWLEGRADMLQQIKGRGRLYELSQQRADLIREANNRDLEGVAVPNEIEIIQRIKYLRLSDIDAPAFTHTKEFAAHFSYIKGKLMDMLKAEGAVAAREEFTEADRYFMRECDLYPTHNGVKIITENDEGARLDLEEIIKLADTLRRYSEVLKQQKEK